MVAHQDEQLEEQNVDHRLARDGQGTGVDMVKVLDMLGLTRHFM